MTKHNYHKLRTEDPPAYWKERNRQKRENHQKEQVAEVLESLISLNVKRGYYTSDDVEKAILKVRGADKRTRQNWFNLLTKLDYLVQNEPYHFSININKIPELESVCKLSPQLSSKQQRLSAFCDAHTHTNLAHFQKGAKEV